MSNPHGHCFWVLLGTRFRIHLRGLLSGFRVTPGLLVPEHPSTVPFCRSFEFSVYFLIGFKNPGCIVLCCQIGWCLVK